MTKRCVARHDKPRDPAFSLCSRTAPGELRRDSPKRLGAKAVAGFVLAVLLAGAGVAAQRPSAPSYDVSEKSIVELQDAMRAGRVTSKDLVESYLARIRAYDQA